MEALWDKAILVPSATHFSTNAWLKETEALGTRDDLEEWTNSTDNGWQQLVAIIPVFRGTITETARLPIYQGERLQLYTNKRKQSQDDRWLSIVERLWTYNRCGRAKGKLHVHERIIWAHHKKFTLWLVWILCVCVTDLREVYSSRRKKNCLLFARLDGL